MFSSRFMLFPTFKKKLVYKNIFFGGGGAIFFFFFRKTLLSLFISGFMLFSTFFWVEILKNAPSLTG